MPHKEGLARNWLDNTLYDASQTTEVLVRWLCCPKDSLCARFQTYERRIPVAFTAISHPYSFDPTVWFTERR
ncbi:hypothetical protein V8C40DRAFT_230488 [Trichoderma camerunense]